MEENNKDTQVVEEEVKENTSVKTYTEQDIQNSFNAGVKKANSEWQKDAKYKEFLDWKKSNQNDSEKIAELQTSNENLKKENEMLKATNKVAKSEVKPEFLKFVTNEVMGLTNDTTDFETALKNYKKENPQFFGEVVIKKTQSSPSLVGGQKAITIDEIFNNMIRNA